MDTEGHLKRLGNQTRTDWWSVLGPVSNNRWTCRSGCKTRCTPAQSRLEWPFGHWHGFDHQQSGDHLHLNWTQLAVTDSCHTATENGCSILLVQCKLWEMWADGEIYVLSMVCKWQDGPSLALQRRKSHKSDGSQEAGSGRKQYLQFCAVCVAISPACFAFEMLVTYRKSLHAWIRRSWTNFMAAVVRTNDGFLWLRRIANSNSQTPKAMIKIAKYSLLE